MLEDDMQLEGGFRETKQHSRRRPSKKRRQNAMAVSVEKKIVATKHDTQKDAYLAANTAPASPPSKSGGSSAIFGSKSAPIFANANFSGKCERSPISVNLIMGG